MYLKNFISVIIFIIACLINNLNSFYFGCTEKKSENSKVKCYIFMKPTGKSFKQNVYKFLSVNKQKVLNDFLYTKKHGREEFGKANDYLSRILDQLQVMDICFRLGIYKKWQNPTYIILCPYTKEKFCFDYLRKKWSLKKKNGVAVDNCISKVPILQKGSGSFKNQYQDTKERSSIDSTNSRRHSFHGGNVVNLDSSSRANRRKILESEI